MKKTIYRVTLYKLHTTSKELALAACYSNSKEGEDRLPLSQLEGLFKAEAMKYPTSNENLQCTVSGNELTIDEKINGEGVCILLIEEIETTELSTLEEVMSMKPQFEGA